MSTLPDIGQVSTAQIDGLQIRLARSGATQGIPILLTSPWPESIYAFRDTLPAIKNLGPIICVDLPGFGRSESRRDVMAPKPMGDFVVRLADHLGISRMHAVGPDVGTLALLFAAVKSPRLFESLVVGSGAASPDLAGKHLRELIFAPAGHFAGLEGGDLGTGFVTQSALHPTPEAVLEDYRLSSAGTRFAAAAAFVQAYPRDLPVLHTLLPQVQTPVLVVAGSDDPTVPPPNGELLARLLPRCKNELIKGGHLVWEDAPAAYAARLARWFGGEYRSL
jgi:pimeloyl-ACP methyl ester carboxylesterase